MTTQRIVFAHLLRGVGALSVLISHYVGIFWIAHPAISDLMGAPVISNFPKLGFPISIVADFCIVFGQFGVGVFFIVSGLVIPYSLENVSRIGFLLRRAMRIYPVYIVGFSVVVLSVLGLSYYTGAPFKFSITNVIAHFGIITRGPLGVDRIDGISWTLEVELYFYLIMVAFGSFVFNFDFKRYLAAAIFIAASAALVMKIWGYLPGAQVGSGLLLLLGITYYSFLRERISLRDLWAIQTLVAILMVILWMGAAGRTSYLIQWVTGYMIAIAVFYVCFYFRDSIKSNVLLSHFSDISYPLYVVHALFGYTIMFILVDGGFSPYVAIASASVSAYGAALLIHIFVEKPTLSWAKSAMGKATRILRT